MITVRADIDDVKADFMRWQSRWPDVSASEVQNDPTLKACDKAFTLTFIFAANFCKSIPVSTANVFATENSRDAFAFDYERRKCAKIVDGIHVCPRKHSD